MINAILLHHDDSVATVTERIAPGGCAVYLMNGQPVQVTAAQEIPQFHKIAVKAVRTGADVIKYGERIGYATRDISVGEHVHTQNLDNQVREEEKA